MLVHHKDLVLKGGTSGSDDPLIQDAGTRPGWLDTLISPAELGPDNLRSREFAEALRWLVPDPSKAFVDVVFGGLYEGRTIKVVGGIGHTLSFGGKYRVTIATSATSAEDAQRSKIVLVNSILAETGLSHGAIVGDYDVDPDYATVAETLPENVPVDAETDVRVGFASPGGNLLTGSGLQEFRLRLGLLNIGGDGVADPGDAADVTLELWEDGNLVESLGSFELTAGTADGGRVVSAFWDAASLADVTGADVEIRVLCETTTTPSPDKYGVIMALRWYAELDGAAYDSGWVDVYPTSFVDPEDWPFARQFAHVIPDGYTLTADYDVVTVRFYDPWNVAGWLDLSRLLIGDALEPPKSFSLGQPITIEDLSPIDISRSGQEFFDVGPVRRVQVFESRALNRDEAHEFQAQFLGRMGTTGEVLVIPSELDQEQVPWEAIYGRLRPGASVTPIVGKRIWTGRFEIQEANVQDGSLQLYASAASIAALATEAGEALMTEAGEVITL